MGKFLAGILIGYLGYYLFSSQPTYIANALSQESGKFGVSFVLSKAGSGQVAIIHGFIDDEEVCEVFRAALERAGGSYFCSPAKEVAPLEDL